MKPEQIDSEERMFSLEDFARLFRRYKRTLATAAVLCGSCAFIYCLLQPVDYKLEATFKENVEGSGQSSFLSALGVFGAGVHSPQASALMQSYQVLKPLISQLGLQVSEVPGGICSCLLRRIKETIQAECGWRLSDCKSLRFTDVVYEQEHPLFFSLRMLDRAVFELEINGRIVQGRLGEKVALEDAQFVLFKVPESFKSLQWRSYSIQPWIGVCESLRSSLKITAHKSNQSIYDLALFHRNRYLGAEILNELMQQYRVYLKRDHNQTAQEQLAYLQQRQEEVDRSFEEVLSNHETSLQHTLGESGCMRLEDHFLAFNEVYQDLFRQSFAAELGMERIAEQQGQARSASSIELGSEETPEYLRQEILGLKQERDLIQASFSWTAEQEEQARICQARELKEVRDDLLVASRAMNALVESGDPQEALHYFFDPDHSVRSWARSLEGGERDREDLALFLQNLIRHCGVREKILQERSFYSSGFSELAGLDLATAKTLLINASYALDQAKAAVQSLSHFAERVNDSSFELSALSAVLTDPLSQKLLHDASALHILLRDGENHSEREEERNRFQLDLQRGMLAEHLKQMIEVEEMKADLYRDKITGLQKNCLDCLNQKISVGYEHIADLHAKKKQAFQREKRLAEQKMRSLREEMQTHFPAQWKMERLLDLRTEVAIKIMESLSQLVESKTIGHHLHHIESKPLDFAFAPLEPRKPRLLFCSLAAACLGVFGTFSGLLFRALLRGFPVAASTLQTLRYPFAGNISFHADGPKVENIADEDLETLRKVVLCIDETPTSRILGLISGRGPNYAPTLASMLAQAGRKVLLIRCDFSVKFSGQDTPGLLDVLQGRLFSLPIRKEGDYDLLPSGGYTRYGMELLRSPRCVDVLKKSKETYDHVLLFSRASLDSAECEAFLRLSDKVLVTVVDEPIHLLTPFMRWAYHENQCRLTFLSSSDS